MNQGPRDEVVIQTPDRRLRVFVSSTLGELAEERRAVSRAISALRLIPVMFELGARPYPPAEVYRAYFAQADVFIGALAEGDSERAARLKGAAEGLRQRVGLPTWPDQRRLEEELVTQIRQKLSATQFDQAFSIGSGLTQRQAVDIARDQPGTGTQPA